MAIPPSMRAVVFKGEYHVAVEDRPVPKLRHSTDALLKVNYTALCGSDLHYYRGHLKCPLDFICGHEFVGTIVEKGDGVTNFKIGDKVVVPFYTACQECFYCKRGQASRCPKGELFGNSVPTNSVDGGQAEYVRVPLANSTLVSAPQSIPAEMLVLMADIFPTGYFAASRFLKDMDVDERENAVVAVVGCGPVGVCAIVSALRWCKTVYAIDTIPSRLEEVAKLGAKPILLSDSPIDKIQVVSDGRGADVVLEAVGNPQAIQLALDLVRPFGRVSSVGVHTQPLPLAGSQLYGKNVTLAFGRCPVRSIFEEALDVLVEEQEKLKSLMGNIVSLEDAPQAFRDFEQQKVCLCSRSCLRRSSRCVLLALAHEADSTVL